MAFLQIKKLLHKSIGLHVDTVGNSSIDRAINQRMCYTGYNNASTYYKFLKSENDELEELIEEVVVPETWFYRNITPFEVLRKNALKIYNNISQENIDNDNNDETLSNSIKILSLPCSSGEEPYSISMALFEGGLSSESYVIDAIDVSKKVLTKSRRAIYGKHSFREKGLNLQEKYFEKIKSGFRLLPSISKSVDFQQGNILTDSISPSSNYYDIIFCRNLLIYFDRNTQRIILEKLSAMLKSGGLLFVGHAEAGQIDKNKYDKVHLDKAFAFCKKPSKRCHVKDSKSIPHPVNKLKDIYDQLVEVTKKDIELSKKIQSPKRGDFKENSCLAMNDLENIKSSINEGHLSDALKQCENILRSQPENADAYYYLGLINSLQGSSGSAESLLRKAIYLSPRHHKALALSAVLAENRGDEEGAKSLRRREQKARQRNS